MSSEGGQVGLVNDEKVLVDGVGYGGATKGMYTEGASVEAPPAGASLGRKKDGIDSDANASDFAAFTKHSAGVSNE